MLIRDYCVKLCRKLHFDPQDPYLYRSSKEVADLIGLPYSTFVKIEQGIVTPHLETFRILMYWYREIDSADFMLHYDEWLNFEIF